MNRHVKIALILGVVLFSLNVIDLVSTYIGLTYYGAVGDNPGIIELNPYTGYTQGMIKAFFSIGLAGLATLAYSVKAFLALKVAIAILGILTIFYIFIDVNNLIVLAQFM